MYKKIDHALSQATYSFTQLGEDLQALEDTLTQSGLRVSGAGRFAEYKRCIERATSHREGHVGVNDEDRGVLYRAMIETHELCLIAEELGSGAEVPGWKEKTQIALGGKPVAGTQQHDHARDIQFELYLAAVARRSGFEVRLDEPDVICLDEGWGRIALAAKRIQSEGKIERHLRKASSQLEASGIPGLVAVDLTWAVADFGAAREGSSNESIGQSLHNEVQGYVGDQAEKYSQQIDPRWAYAILVHVVAPCVIDGARLGRNRVLRWLNFRESASQEGAAVLSFMKRLRWEG